VSGAGETVDAGQRAEAMGGAVTSGLAEGAALRPGSGRYGAAAWIFCRSVGLTYLIAFLSLHGQLLGLVGAGGIRPAEELLGLAGSRFGDDAWLRLPTVLWTTGASDEALLAVCAAGELAAGALLVGLLPGLAALASWGLYLSLVSVGSPFLPLQWDTLLLEVGFLTAFLAGPRLWTPPWDARNPAWPARWALGLLAFRLHFASGVVKLASGDGSWWSLRALDHHFETQPLPNPVSYWAHHAPDLVNQALTASTLGLELIAPWGLLALASDRAEEPRLRRRLRQGSALALVALQLGFAATGNFGFFNLLALALLVPFFDDASLAPWLRRVVPTPGLAEPRASQLPGGPDAGRGRRGFWAWTGISAAPVTVVAFLGLIQLGVVVPGLSALVPDPARRLVSALAPFRVANGYGLFAVMTTDRPELVFEGTADGETWKPYRFHYKPGPLDRGLPFVAPHMPRLDWQLWFAALGSERQHPWVVSFMGRLLEAEPSVLHLLARDPFRGTPPVGVRALLYDYAYAAPQERREPGRVWRRTLLGRWGPRLARRPPAPADDARIPEGEGGEGGEGLGE